MSTVCAEIGVMLSPEALFASLTARWEDEQGFPPPRGGLEMLHFVPGAERTAEAHGGDRLVLRVKIAPGLADGSRLRLTAEYRARNWSDWLGEWLAGRWLRSHAMRRCLRSWKGYAEREWTLGRLCIESPPPRSLPRLNGSPADPIHRRKP